MKASSCEASPGGCGREQGAVWWLRGLLLGHRLVDHAHDVGLLHDQEILAVDLDLGAGPLAEQHAVADLDVDRNELAGFVAATRANSDDFALGRLLLGGVGNDDASGRLRLGVDALDDDAVVKRTKLHGILHKQLIRQVSEGWAKSPDTFWIARGSRPSDEGREAFSTLDRECQQKNRALCY